MHIINRRSAINQLIRLIQLIDSEERQSSKSIKKRKVLLEILEWFVIH